MRSAVSWKDWEGGSRGLSQGTPPSEDWKLVPHKRICVTASVNLIVVFRFEWCVTHIFVQSYSYIVIIALSTVVLSSPILVKALLCPSLPDICKSIAFF